MGCPLLASVLLCPEAKVGDYALVHVGFAISVIDEEEALKVLAHFEQLGELQAELDEAAGETVQ